MKILITNFWTQNNRGDAAILSSTLSFLKELFPHADIDFVSMHKDTFTTPELPVDPTQTLNILETSPKGSQLKKYSEFAYNCVSSVVWIYFFRIFGLKLNIILRKNIQKVLKAYTESSVVFPIGGGYLTAGKGVNSTIFFLILFYPILLGVLLKKRVVMLWQSVGPFGNWFQKAFSKFVLKKVDLIFAREHYTISLLREMGIKPEKIIDSGDIAFYFKPVTKDQMKQELVSLRNGTDKPLVGITARHWFNPGSVEESNYINSLIESIRYLLERKYEIVLLPQVTSEYERLDDRNFLEKIKGAFKDESSVILPRKNYNHFEYKGIYENLYFLIGTRMHSNIFALSGLTPVLAIAYEYKTRGIMDDLGLSDYVIDIDAISREKIENLIGRLETHRDHYVQTLDQNLKNYIIKLDLSKQIIRDLF